MNNLLDYFDKILNKEKLSHSYIIGNTTYDEISENLNSIINKYIFNYDVEKSVNPDIYVLKSENSIITKDEIKELLKNITTTSQFNNKKVYIIDKCEKLSDFSYNAILKTLEEPKENIFAFLISSNIDSVKPTILSRCQKIFISSKVENNEFNEDVINIGNKVIKYIENDEIKTIGLHPDIYELIEDRNILKNVLKYILSVYYKKLNSIIDKKESNDIILNNDINIISKMILVIDGNINRLDNYLNKNLSIDRFIIEMWRCKNENS